MTREEQINTLKVIIQECEEYQWQRKETLYEIIKVLEQEPCEDAISRRGVIDAMIKRFDGKYAHDEFWNCDMVMGVLRDMPPANSQEPKWIPVSERLPKEYKTVIASTDLGVYPETRYSKEYGWEWAYDAGADYWKELAGVTAWMPLPKPYEPRESESKRCMELARSYVQGLQAGLAESEDQKDIINEAYLRANSIDAVRGFAYRSEHTRESEELDRARTMIFKLIDYIKTECEEVRK